MVYACSTEKNAPINRGYHNMTARYNGYFNAGEIINLSLNSYRNKYKDDYTKILPLDVFPDEESASSLFTEMEKAIEKSSRVIVRHTMPDPNVVKSKSEENCKWIDDNWFIIGKSYYIKREYPQAKEKFEYVIKTYEGQESVYASRIWLSKIYIEQGEYGKAKIELGKAKIEMETADAHSRSFKDIINFNGKSEDGRKLTKYQRKKQRQERKNNKKTQPEKFSKKLKKEFEITYATLYIETKDYKKAIEHIEKALPLTRKRKERARYMFVLGQLYKETGNNQMAAYYFEKVAKSNAPYEMRFYAKINKSLCSSAGSAVIRKELYKMLKDGKNAEYKDQIYYVLAQIDLKEGKRTEAKQNLSQSVFHSINNDRQKGISYLQLGDLHFEEKDYIKSQKYYDSCVQVLPKTYENYEYIESKAKGLSELVFHYETVVREDSLQKIAMMPEKEREKFLKETIKQIKEDEERKKAEEEARLIAQQKKANDMAMNSGSGNKWYFYNSKAVAGGFNDFRSTWGQRPLEDDWRRSNKESIGDFEEMESDTTVAAVDSLTVEVLMKDLPLTQEAVDSSNKLIINSLYYLGMIYKEQLKEEKEAISYFNQVIDRNIPHEKVLPSAYQLYLIYKKKGDPLAEKYKNIILNDYPDSEIAEVIKDPDYFKKKAEKDRRELDEYGQTYKDYTYRKYIPVITKCNEIIFNQRENQYLSKYYLLKAFAISKTNIGGIEAVEAPLRELYELSPDSPEGKQAKTYLDRIVKGEKIVEPDETKDPSIIPYTLNKTAVHQFVLLFPNKSTGNINDIKMKVSNFNTSFFKSEPLKLKNSILGEEYETIIVETFENYAKAMAYFRAFKSEVGAETLGTIANDYDIFVISKPNFSLFYKNQDVDGYKVFFTENYK